MTMADQAPLFTSIPAPPENRCRNIRALWGRLGRATRTFNDRTRRVERLEIKLQGFLNSNQLVNASWAAKDLRHWREMIQRSEDALASIKSEIEADPWSPKVVK